MKTYFLIAILSLIFSFSTLEAMAQNQTVEKTKEKAKNKTNNRIDNKIDNKLDEGLDAIEGLFKRKKKKKKKEEEKNDNNSENNSNQSTETQNNTGSGFLDNLLGGGNGEKIDIKSSYNFNSNFVMRMQMYKKNGKEDGDMFIRYYNSADPNYMAMEVMESTKDGKIKSLESKVIVDGSQQAMITIMEDQKQAIAMKMPNIENYEQAQEQEQNPDQAMKDVKITRTGRTKNILGYTCSETIMESNDMKATSWTTKQVKLSQFKAFAGMMIQNKKDKNQLMAVPLEFTMEMESIDKKTGEKTKMTVTEVNENQNSTIDMSSYKVMDMSGLMKGGN
ncbi:hypothetical protein V9L05_08260 [Bernardetia sp. Wsw4-3y2]|uniref:hypothetical protein n=1 Tax=Bernardetia sp. Wsw4-3y2 TaxID=3127471 RepID=UPI0030D3732C